MVILQVNCMGLAYGRRCHIGLWIIICSLSCIGPLCLNPRTRKKFPTPVMFRYFHIDCLPVRYRPGLGGSRIFFFPSKNNPSPPPKKNLNKATEPGLQVHTNSPAGKNRRGGLHLRIAPTYISTRGGGRKKEWPCTYEVGWKSMLSRVISTR